MKRIGVFACCAVLLLLTACGPSLQELGEQAVAKVEAFRQQNGRVPESLKEAGLRDEGSGPVYYKTDAACLYLVYYREGLGESVSYCGATHQWTQTTGQ